MTETGRRHMPILHSLLLLLLLLFCCEFPANSPAAAAPNGSCGLAKIAVGPAKPDDYRTFLGGGKKIRIEVANENPERPDSPVLQPAMTVRNADTQTSCQLEGGIWDKDGMFLSRDENTLVLAEYSGSSVRLVFVDTADCKTTASIDVSGKWRIDKEQVFYQGYCECSGPRYECAPATVHRLGADCRPELLAEESRAFTGEVFGVEFAEKSILLAPGTPGAEVVGGASGNCGDSASGL